MNGDGIVRDSDFTGLTVGSLDTGYLVFERRHVDGRMQVWIAPPGQNDGPGMWLSDADAQLVTAFLTAGPNAPWLDDVNGFLGQPSGGYPHRVTICGRASRSWSWFPPSDGRGRGVAIHQDSADQFVVDMWNNATRRRVQTSLTAEPTDEDMRPLLRLVGLLPTAPATAPTPEAARA